MSIPFALSLDKYVNKAGTDVGFGCLLAVALLVLLYFAAARETRTLREQLEDAHERITNLEGRVSQALRNQASARSQASQQTQVPNVPGRPGVVPAPSVAQPMGSAVARVRREGAPPVGPATAVTGALLGAPSGAGAPALGSATKLIPSPEAAPVSAPTVGTPMAVPAAATAAATMASAPVSEAYGDEDDDFDDFEPDDTMYVPAGATAAANGRGGGPAVAPAPTMDFADDEDLAGPPPRRTVPTVDYAPEGRRRIPRLLGGLILLLVVAAVVVVLLVITKNGSSDNTNTTAAQATATKTTPTKVVFNPAKVKVSVLNGTGQSGLAGDVANLIKKSGYTVPEASITNAAIQTATTTTVAYRQGFRAYAVRVARSLSKTSRVVIATPIAADAASITSCATPTATGQTGTCPANVIVTVGTDLESAASGSTSG
jgi:hypothetical protein